MVNETPKLCMKNNSVLKEEKLKALMNYYLVVITVANHNYFSVLIAFTESWPIVTFKMMSRHML